MELHAIVTDEGEVLSIRERGDGFGTEAEKLFQVVEWEIETIEDEIFRAYLMQAEHPHPSVGNPFMATDLRDVPGVDADAPWIKGRWPRKNKGSKKDEFEQRVRVDWKKLPKEKKDRIKDKKVKVEPLTKDEFDRTDNNGKKLE